MVCTTQSGLLNYDTW